MTRAYVSIGSNMDRERYIRAAVAVLQQKFGNVALSQVYETEAVGFRGAPFYNLVAGFDTALPVDDLLAWLTEVEDYFGRDRSAPRFGPRTLDMDLLLFGDLVDEARKLPREEIGRYAFVLGPLAEIAPHSRHPVSGDTFASLWQCFDSDSQSLKPVALTFPEVPGPESPPG